MNCADHLILLVVVGLAGCASQLRQPDHSTPEEPAEIGANHRKIVQLLDEIRIPMGTSRDEVAKLLPFHAETPAGSSESLLNYATGDVVRDEVYYVVPVEAVLTKGSLRFSARIYTAYIDDKLVDFGVTMPDAFPREWVVWNGKVFSKQDEPVVISRFLVIQMEALKQMLESVKKEPTTIRGRTSESPPSDSGRSAVPIS